MKKLLLFSAMLCFGIMTFAQKQQTDSKTVEVNFTPWGNAPISINGIKVRKFTDDYNAVRLEVNLGFNSNKDVSAQAGVMGDDNNSNELLYSKSGGFNFMVSPGVEKHFDGTNRLTPYVGGILNFGFNSSSATEEYWSPNKIEALNDGDLTNNFTDFVKWEQKTKNGGIMLGLAAVAGMDFYFADNIYFGTEISFGFGFNSTSVTKYESSNNDAWAITSLDPTLTPDMPIGVNANWGTGSYDIPGVNGNDTDELANITARGDDKNGSTLSIMPTVNGALRFGFIIK